MCIRDSCKGGPLDKVPQFLNVPVGDPFVIGLRPVTLEEAHEFGDALDEILARKPGITGWRQVTARNDAPWADDERQLFELPYVCHASLLLDVRVCMRTFKVMSRGR